MTKRELEKSRQRLVDMGNDLRDKERAHAQEALRKTGGEASGNLSNTPVHIADLGTDAYEQEVALSLLESEEQHLADIVGAIDRIDQGTYGKCEECSQDIARERLNAVPWTRFCVQCASRREQEKTHPASPGNL